VQLHLALFGPAAVQALSRVNALLIVVMGLGPMGVAVLTWDIALKHGDPRDVGALAYLTPMLTTVLLTQVNGHTFSS
jgi:drug/metabolite transporter (DMT)-like permease